jgi:transketolase
MTTRTDMPPALTAADERFRSHLRDLMREALDKAAYYKLGNLTALIDVNRLGQRGPTELEWDMDSYRRMAGISGANIKPGGSHAGTEIGPDGPSQMALEDLAALRAPPCSRRWPVPACRCGSGSAR